MPMGPTPKPSISVRSWDHFLLKRYRPFYAPFCDLCRMCTYRKTSRKKGACSMDMDAGALVIARKSDSASHEGHALLREMKKKFDDDVEIDLGPEG